MIILDTGPWDWTAFRQSLSLSLLTGKPVTLRGGIPFLQSNPLCANIMSDWEDIFHQSGTGRLMARGQDVEFYPSPVSYGIYQFLTCPCSSAVETLLLFLPVLFTLPFRSSLSCEGVTQSRLSAPVNFWNECFLAHLESLGFYAHLSLRRYGFFGSGQGRIQAKVYPFEKTGVIRETGEKKTELVGARVVLSGLSMELAARQKNLLIKRTGLPQDKISLIEVQDSAGSGHLVQIFHMRDGVPLIYSLSLDAYNAAGGYVYDSIPVDDCLGEFLGEVEASESSGRWPDFLIRELLPYYRLAGRDDANLHSGCAEATKRVMDLLL